MTLLRAEEHEPKVWSKNKKKIEQLLREVKGDNKK